MQAHAAQHQRIFVGRGQPQRHLQSVRAGGGAQVAQFNAKAAHDGQRRLQGGDGGIRFDAKSVVFVCGIHANRISRAA